jgi:hypothetical protein
MSSKSLRTFARGKPCMCRLAGICNFNPETTVLAHIRRAHVAGAGQKPPDMCAVFACSACHDVIDGRMEHRLPLPLSELTRLELEALVIRLSLDSDILSALVRQLAWYDKNEVLVAVL